MLDTRLVTWTLGIWASATFLVCVIHGVIVPERLHMRAFLEQVLPAFEVADAGRLRARIAGELPVWRIRRRALLLDLQPVVAPARRDRVCALTTLGKRSFP